MEELGRLTILEEDRNSLTITVGPLSSRVLSIVTLGWIAFVCASAIGVSEIGNFALAILAVSFQIPFVLFGILILTWNILQRDELLVSSGSVTITRRTLTGTRQNTYEGSNISRFRAYTPKSWAAPYGNWEMLGLGMWHVDLELEGQRIRIFRQINQGQAKAIAKAVKCMGYSSALDDGELKC